MATTLYAGIDVGKDRLDIVVRPGEVHKRFANTKAGWRRLLAWLQPQGEALVVLEATGGYEAGVVAALDHAGVAVVVRNPLAMRRFAQSELRFAKTDRVDAALLAQYAEQRQPQPRPLPDETGRTVAALLTRRRQLGQQRAAEKTRVQQPLPEPVQAVLVAQLQTHIAELTTQIAQIDQLLAETVQTDPARQQVAAQLATTPGIGVLTATRLVAGLPELGHVSAKAIALLVGVAPHANDSGRRQGPRQIGGGRRWVRHALYEAVTTTVRCDPTFRAHYRQLRARGKPHKVAMVACMRRLLGILNAMVRHGLTWQETEVGKGTFLPDAA